MESARVSGVRQPIRRFVETDGRKTERRARLRDAVT